MRKRSNICQLIKVLLSKSYVATGISIIALTVSLLGSPFMEGSILNPESPKVSVTSLSTIKNITKAPGEFVTALKVLNGGAVDSEVWEEIALYTEDGSQIRNLSDGIGPKSIILEAGNQVSILATSDNVPEYLAVCLKLESVDSWETGRFLRIYRRGFEFSEMSSTVLYSPSEKASVPEDIDLPDCR